MKLTAMVFTLAPIASPSVCEVISPLPDVPRHAPSPDVPRHAPPPDVLRQEPHSPKRGIVRYLHYWQYHLSDWLRRFASLSDLQIVEHLHLDHKLDVRHLSPACIDRQETCLHYIKGKPNDRVK